MSTASSSAPMPTVTCDQCRVRKVRCNPGPPIGSPSSSPDASGDKQSHGQCRNCARRGEDCTYAYTPRKPGRPRAPPAPRPTKRQRTEQPSKSRSRSPRRARADTTPPVPDRATVTESGGSGPATVSSSQCMPPPPLTSAHASLSPMIQGDDPLPSVDLSGASPGGPIMGSIFGSAWQTLQAVPFDFTLPRSAETDRKDTAGPSPGIDRMTGDAALDAAPQLAGLKMFDYSVPAKGDSRRVYSPSTILDDLVGASVGAGGMGRWSDSSAGQVDAAVDETAALRPCGADIDVSRIESFASWEDIGFFLSLHMKHQHVLVPLVHRSSFAQDVLYRRDENDEAFRGLLLSIVAYTICQCPIQWLVPRMAKPELEALLERCQRGSRIIQIRHQTRPSLVVLASTILDWITSQAASAAQLPSILMSDIRRLVYTLGLNRTTPRPGLSELELQLCRRLYWEAYAIDKTNALNGHPYNLLDMDGCPPFPLEVDDEYMIADGGAMLPQPKGRLSFMTGFVYVTRLYRELSRCVAWQRTLVNVPEGAPRRASLGVWVERTMVRVQELLSEMPEELQPYNAKGDGTHSVFETQAANIYITALCLELALLDLRAKVTPEVDSEQERFEIAKRAFRQLERMPLECLASNGESLRGKVLRVILALLNAQSGGEIGDGLWDWWNIYSRVQFIQLMPDIRHSDTGAGAPDLSAILLDGGGTGMNVDAGFNMGMGAFTGLEEVLGLGMLPGMEAGGQITEQLF